ncbi:MAG TPA: hypothetical protein VI032_06385 [Burkholderiaceae bacterium]
MSPLALQRHQQQRIGALGACHDAALAWLLLAGLALVCGHGSARAQQSANGIYTCVDDKGRLRTADRMIAECSDREQRVLNKDGSIKRIVPPTLTAEERAEREAQTRKELEEKAAYSDAVRRDRNLKIRYPNEAAHNKARESALEAVRTSMRTSAQRIKDLETERKPLQDEADFYRGRQLPARLKQQLEANETSVAAQRELMQTQESELQRVNRIYDMELDHLRKLWKGAPPGSISLVSAPLAQTEPR